MEMTDEMKAMIDAREAEAREKGITDKIKYATKLLGADGYDKERNGMKSVTLGNMIVENVDVTGPVRGYYNRYKVTVGGKVVYNDHVGKENSDSTGYSWKDPSYFEAYIPGQGKAISILWLTKRLK